MADIWDFFENMDELVYVADMDTYDMVYMNLAGNDTIRTYIT
mgnify:CR=1 FL=1